MTFDRCLAEAARHQQAGRLPEAWAAYRRALALKPRHADTLHRLGLLALQAGRPDAAAEAFEQAVEAARPRAPAAYYANLGLALSQLGYAQDAERALRTAVRLEPALAPAHTLLGNALHVQGRLGEAVAAWRRAIELDPASGAALTNLGNALVTLGEVEEALALHRRAIAAGPDAETAWDNYLYAMANLADPDPAFVRAEHERWAAAWLAGPDAPRPRAAWPNAPDPARRLRVGFLSGDFREHSVAYFAAPVLRHLDRAAFEVFCYSNVRVPDAVTERLRALPLTWRSVAGADDAAAAATIARYAVDVLVELGGHTAANRLRVLGHRPAPVQATWLGYPGTTGLPACAYRLTDAVSDPPGLTDAHYGEALLRLPATSWCYRPPEPDVPVAPPPCAANGVVTFGSFNTVNKANARVLDAWGRILAQAPGARLVLKSRGLDDATLRARVLDGLAARGVDPARVGLLGFEAGTAAHLARYADVDVALDTFPYNGTTTTCEALWQGVPVVAFEGDVHLARVGAALLRAAGLDELVGRTVDDYVATAVALARDPARVAALRRGLRDRVAASPLCDGPGFAREFGARLREAWAEWCAGAAQPASGR